MEWGTIRKMRIYNVKESYPYIEKERRLLTEDEQKEINSQLLDEMGTKTEMRLSIFFLCSTCNCILPLIKSCKLISKNRKKYP